MMLLGDNKAKRGKVQEYECERVSMRVRESER